MLLFKSKLYTLVLLLSFSANAAFDEMECLNSNFSTTVSHKGAPFGLAKNVLKVEKENCVITIDHQKLKFMKKKFLIDVCRAPVHIKSGAGAVEVLKRESDCGKKSKGEYCKALKNIENMIQDDGLIFAKGEKENLNTDHGRIYCTYLLVKSYLGVGKVLSRHGGGLKVPGTIPLIAPSELKGKTEEGVDKSMAETPKVESTPSSNSNPGGSDF
ncbi:MAG: hypothetical protein KC493_09220 [Bacteriovoracaceae bacterium]|nr:hypothetical protein [Bacteriovoracaceae bacterium]